MADVPAGQAIEIIGALNEAGLLRTAHDTSQPATTPEPPPPPDPKVGDEAFLGNIRQIQQNFGPMGPAGVAQVILTNSALLGKGDYYIDFPPNNAGWLQGIDKIIASPKKGLYVVASVKITDVPRSGTYVGNLTYLNATFSFD